MDVCLRLRTTFICICLIVTCIGNLSVSHWPEIPQKGQKHKVRWYKLIFDASTPLDKEIKEKLPSSLSRCLENEFQRVPDNRAKTIHFELDGEKYSLDIDKTFKGVFPLKDGYLHLKLLSKGKWFTCFRNVTKINKSGASMHYHI